MTPCIMYHLNTFSANWVPHVSRWRYHCQNFVVVVVVVVVVAVVVVVVVVAVAANTYF